MSVCYLKSHGKPGKDLNKVVCVMGPPAAFPFFCSPGAKTRLSSVSHLQYLTVFPGNYSESLSGFGTPRVHLAHSTWSELMVMMVETLSLRPPGQAIRLCVCLVPSVLENLPLNTCSTPSFDLQCSRGGRVTWN